MTTEAGARACRSRKAIRCRLLALAALGGGLLAGCGSSGNSSAGPAPAASGAGQAGGSQAPQPQGSSAAGSSATFKLAGIFPAGPGRELVLETCGACHPVACSALGQRTAASWDGVKKSHEDKLTAHSGANVDAMFSYLKANFNDTRPEPKIPPEFVQQGCTPY